MDYLGPSPPDDVFEAPLDPTPEEIRERLGRFPMAVRGYDPGLVDAFLTTTADCLEGVAAWNVTLTERVNALGKAVHLHETRAWAVQEAMVTAQTILAEARERAEAEATRINDEAENAADALTSAAREELALARAEVEDLAKKAAGLRDEIRGELAEKRRTALEDAERIVAEAKADANTEGMRIRDHAKAEAEVLRSDALTEISQLRDAAASEIQELRARVEADVAKLRQEAETEVAQLRQEAERAVKEMEDESLLHLERRASRLMTQIEERHEVLARLEERRLEFLEQLRVVLMREIDAVELESKRPPVGERSEAGVLDPGSAMMSRAEPLPTGGVAIKRRSGAEAPVRGIIMPDKSVVILGDPPGSGIGPKPLTDSPSPLDPGADPIDDEPDRAASEGELIVPWDQRTQDEDGTAEGQPVQ